MGGFYEALLEHVRVQGYGQTGGRATSCLILSIIGASVAALNAVTASPRPVGPLYAPLPLLPRLAGRELAPHILVEPRDTVTVLALGATAPG